MKLDIIKFMHAMGPLRTGLDGGNGVLYNLEDTSRGLGYIETKNGTQYIQKYRVVPILRNLGITGFPHREENQSISTSQDFGNIWLDEADFWDFVSYSQTSIARSFRRWICTDVLPELAKHRVYIMDEATDADIANAVKFRTTRIEQTFSNVTLTTFLDLFRQLQEHIGAGKHRRKCEVYKAVHKLVKEKFKASAGEDRIHWDSHLAVVKHAISASERQVKIDERRQITKRLNREIALVTPLKEELHNQHESATTLQASVINLHEQLSVMRNDLDEKNKLLSDITQRFRNGSVVAWPTWAEQDHLNIHGFSVNYQYSPKIFGLPEDLRRCYQPAVDWFNAQAVTRPQDYFRLFGLERSPKYEEWIRNFDALPIAPASKWNMNGSDPVAIYIDMVCKSVSDLDNMLKSFIDRLMRRYGYTNDNFVQEIHVRRIGTCTTYDTGKIHYAIRPVQR